MGSLKGVGVRRPLLLRVILAVHGLLRWVWAEKAVAGMGFVQDVGMRSPLVSSAQKALSSAWPAAGGLSRGL